MHVRMWVQSKDYWFTCEPDLYPIANLERALFKESELLCNY